MFVVTIAGLLSHDTVNPNDLSGGGSKKALDLHFDVKFDGINTSLLQKEEEIIHTSVTGIHHPPTYTYQTSEQPSSHGLLA